MVDTVIIRKNLENIKDFFFLDEKKNGQEKIRKKYIVEISRKFLESWNPLEA